MKLNFSILFISALVPLITGLIWYGTLFKNAWTKQIGFTNENTKKTNLPLLLGVGYVLGLLISAGLLPVVIHQMGMQSTLISEPGFNEKTGEAFKLFMAFMDNYGGNFRTFKHGALHGVLTALFVIMPILTIQALLEKKRFKYIAINVGYWIVTLAIIGGILSKWV